METDASISRGLSGDIQARWGARYFQDLSVGLVGVALDMEVDLAHREQSPREYRVVQHSDNCKRLLAPQSDIYEEGPVQQEQTS